MIFTHAQVRAWGLRYGWPALALEDGRYLPPGRESYIDLDNTLLHLISLRIAHWNERVSSPECSEDARILPKKVLLFERKMA